MTMFRYVFVDVFTDVPFAGNQLAVFTNAQEIPEDLLQPLAREIGFSETVFCYPPTRRQSPSGTGPQEALGRENDEETVFVYPPSAEGNVRIRIFTPALELPFAGHPILGTAFVLAGPLQLEEIRLECEAGIVPVRLERDGSRITFGWMTQPPFSHEPYADADALLALLGIAAAESPVELYRQGPQHVVVEVASPDAVTALRPDFGALETLSPYGTACIARDGDAWKARVFVPAHGVPEDAATGSAAGPIALHLARHGRTEFGQEIEIHQGAEIDRPSLLYANARSETEIEVGGTAVIVARGEFRL